MKYPPSKSHNRESKYDLLLNPELGNLLQFANALYDPKQRTHIDDIVVILQSNDTIGKLLVIFEQCAEQGDLSNMRTLRGIFNTMLLWAHADMIQELIMEKHILGVLGVLEFMSKRNLSYREQFKSMPRMDLGGTLLKEGLIRTIREAEHLEFFKYQVAPQYQQKSQLIQVLERSIRWKHLNIVNWIQQDGILTKRIFHQLDNKDATIIDRQITLNFVHHVLLFAGKDMEQFASSSFIRTLAGKGLLDLIQRLINDDDTEIRRTAAKVLYTITQLDVWILQDHILAQVDKGKQKSNLLQTTLDQLANVEDYALKQQLFDVMKALLGLAEGSSSFQSSSSFTSQSIFDDSPVTGSMLKLFYERYAFALIRTTHSIDIKPLDMTNPMEPLDIDNQQFLFFGSLCEFLRLILVQYGNRTKRILQDPCCFGNMAQLFRHQDASLKLKTLRFFRAAIGLRDMDINAMLVRQNVFAFITQLLIDTNTQQNHTIHSEIEELLDFIRNMNMINLIDHILKEYGNLLEVNLPTSLYNSLVVRHEKNIADGSSFTTTS